MKTFKLFSHMIAIFGVVMMCALNGWSTAESDISNNVCTTADSLLSTSDATGTYTGNAKNSDTDYYKITLLAEGKLTITATRISGKNFNIEVMDGCGGTVLQSGTNIEVTPFSYTKNVNVGTYIVKITGVDPAASNYTIVATHQTDAERDFTKLVSYKLIGNVSTIGNTVLCPKNADGTCKDTSANNAGLDLKYITDSAATLQIPATNYEIKWAGLFWLGVAPEATSLATAITNFSSASAKAIKLKRPDGTQVQVPWTGSSKLDTYLEQKAGYYFKVYAAYTEVTDIVKAGGVGSYKVNDLFTDTGATDNPDGNYGAWAMVTIYQDNDSGTTNTFKDISVFNGYKRIVEQVGTTFKLDGFLAPKSGNVFSKLSIFTAEADKVFDGDKLWVKAGKAASFSQVVYPGGSLTNTFVSNISIPSLLTPTVPGSLPRTPALTYNYATDLHSIEIGNNPESTYKLIGNSETSLEVKITTDSDSFYANMAVLATDLYVPRFCYDYGYEQNGISFTEENSGIQMPRISGFLPNTSDINVSIYIKNKENSDISANNLRLNINDINTSQAIYQRNSVAVTFPDAYIPIAKTDAAWPLNVDDAYVRNIPLGDIAGNQYAYAYYGLTPLAMGDINMSIAGTFSYDLTIPLPDATTLILPYSSTIGGSALPMCSADNFSYTPAWGIFSVVDAGLYDSTAANRYYNLTTQVAKRPGNLRVAAFDANLTDTPKAVSTTVAVELIDASLFHDVDAACHEPSSAITPRVWVTFDNNVSQVNFNKTTIDTAIANGMVSDGITGVAMTLANAEDFFRTATKNAAFRVSYNVTNDGNDSLVQTAPGTQPGETKILNFTQLVQDIQHCSQPVEIPSNPGNTTTLVAVACGNAGNQGIDKHNLAICMECLYGYNTNILCSRDNFAIRPESYTVNLKDINQTTNATLNAFATDRTGVLTPNSARVDMAGGYIYNYEINATNHLDNANTLGYTRNFTGTSNDFNITFVWEPTTSKTGCNDTNSLPQNFYIGDGFFNGNGILNQVGEYRLNIIDKTWTAVDWDPLMQVHQTGSHFLAGDDCLLGSTIVPLHADVTSLSGGTINNPVGCDISSTHNNAENSLKYRDYLMTFHPYQFNVGLTHGLGATAAAIVAGGEGFVYDANLANTNEMNMSVRSTGTISAVGFAGNQLSNFVKECYAKDLNVTMGHDANTAMATPFVSRVVYSSAAGVQVFDSNKTNVAANVMKTSVDDSNFTKVDNGAVGTLIRLNFDRNTTTPLDPQRVEYKDINVTCTVAGECSRQADGAVGDADGTALMDFNVTHVYGRIGTLNVRATKNTPFNAFAYYEVYNAPNLLNVAPSLTEYPAGSLWYINTLHDSESKDGNMSIEFVLTGGANPTASLYDTNGTKTYNFPGYSVSGNYTAHINTEGWLWYAPNALGYLEPVNPTAIDCLTHPCFNIRIGNLVGRTGSAETVSESTKDNKNSTSTGWRSTSDYAPAIR